jgi:hypothetical protein
MGVRYVKLHLQKYQMASGERCLKRKKRRPPLRNDGASHNQDRPGKVDHDITAPLM